MKRKMIPIIFEGAEARRFLFNILDKSVGSDGYLVEGNNRDQKVVTPDGEYIKPEEVGVVRPGSQVFIKKDMVSLIKFASDLI